MTFFLWIIVVDVYGAFITEKWANSLGEYVIKEKSVGNLAIVVGSIQTNIISDFWILLIAVGLLILGIKVWADNN